MQRMVDDSSAKRPKTALVADMRRRNAPLESEVQRLRSEIEQLRRRIRQLEGNHEVLPVVVAPVTVDLSRVDTNIVAHITSFLGESCELLNLALTCKSFGQPASTTTLSLSLVEEVARQAVCSRTTDAEMSCLPWYAPVRRHGCQSSMNLSAIGSCLTILMLRKGTTNL